MAGSMSGPYCTWRYSGLHRGFITAQHKIVCTDAEIGEIGEADTIKEPFATAACPEYDTGFCAKPSCP
jgi:hypothetical protein